VHVADFWLRMMGSAAIASLVVAGVMACEQSQRLAGSAKQRRKPSQDKRDHPPPEA
jgi:hypothetical protein